MTARLLVIMGSGETAPTMVKTHRAVLERFDQPVPAVLLDTPYRFQGNADDISGRIVEHFRSSLNQTISVATLPDEVRARSDSGCDRDRSGAPTTSSPDPAARVTPSADGGDRTYRRS